MSAQDRLAPTEEAAGWASLGSIYRRASLFRILGKPQAAQLVLDGEISPLLSKLGAAPDDPRVVAVRGEQERRVEDASLVAQLLAPLLQAHSAPALPADDKVVAFEPPAPATPAGPLSIADMIDGMLAQERKARTR